MKAAEKPWTPYTFPKLVVKFPFEPYDVFVEPSSFEAGEVFLSLGGNGEHLTPSEARRLAKALLKFAARKTVPKGAR